MLVSCKTTLVALAVSDPATIGKAVVRFVAETAAFRLYPVTALTRYRLGVPVVPNPPRSVVVPENAVEDFRTKLWTKPFPKRANRGTVWVSAAAFAIVAAVHPVPETTRFVELLVTVHLIQAGSAPGFDGL